MQFVLLKIYPPAIKSEIVRIFSKRFLFISNLALTTKTMETWRGVPLCDIYGSSSPWGAPEFPLVSPAYNHAVLYHINQSRDPVLGNKPRSPQRGQDKWDKECVRMPCSTHSLYPVEEEDGSTNLVKRWDLIRSALNKPIRNSKELAEAILSYNTKFKHQWRFRALHYLFNEYLEEEETEYFFNVTLPEIARLALSLPHLIQSPIPLLRQHRNRSVSLTQEQIACLLANAFFCTFPRRNNHKKASEYASYPQINFNSLYESSASPSVMEKIKCLCHYFRRVCTKVSSGVVTFCRRTVEPAGCPAWAASQRLLGSVPLHVNSSGTIEDDGVGLIQVDFANKYLGGGVLNHGCVQEEIRFVICPELLISMLFTESLKPTEALLIIGCERYSKYTGYGNSFRWSGDFADHTPRDSSGRLRCAVLAIDAMPLHNDRTQYKPEVIKRELNKAWVGFSVCTPPQDGSPLHRPGVATGNWGCGAFGGSPRLKSLLQLAASAQARRPLAYYTFGDEPLRNDVARMYSFLSRHNVTVGQLYDYLMSFSGSGLSSSELYPYIQQMQQDSTQKNIKNEKVVEPPSSSNTDKRPASPDLFSSSEPSSQSEPFVDLEKGDVSIQNRNTLTVNLDRCVMEKDVDRKQVHGGTDSKQISNDAECKIKTDVSDLKIDKPIEKSKCETQTSSLFDDMTKFDDESATANFKKPINSPFRIDFNTKKSESNTETVETLKSMDGSEKDTDMLISEDKNVEKRSDKTENKKISKKITDYFSKKF